MAAMKLKTPTISNKPSEAILQALADLEKVEKNPKYRINMDDYHYPNNEDPNKVICEVCFAGAVIAQAGNDSSLEISPNDFNQKTSDKLNALDCFRVGAISSGLDNFGLKKKPLIFTLEDGDINVDITPYSISKVKFKKEMTQLAKEFEALGI